MSLRDCYQGQPATGDLRSQVQALLASSQPPREYSAPSRRKAHPLYPANGGGGTAARRQGGSSCSRAASQGGRSRSQPPSPTGISKARPVRGSSSRGPVKESVSAGTSPVQHAPQKQTPGPSALRQLQFGCQPLAPRTQDAHPWPSNAVQGQPGPKSQQAGRGREFVSADADLLPGLARLGIASPAASPQCSPARWQTQERSPWRQPLQQRQEQQQEQARLPRPQQQQRAPTPSASQPGAVSQWRWQQHIQQQGLLAGSPPQESPVPPTPGTSSRDVENSGSVALSPACEGSPTLWTGPSPDVCSLQQAPASPSQQAVPASPGTAAGAARAPPVLFNSSQERRQEIEILMQMAAQEGAWSSQGSPASLQPYTCRLTSQQLAELPDPCSQPESAQEQQLDQPDQLVQPPEDNPQWRGDAGRQADAGTEEHRRWQDERRQHCAGRQSSSAQAPARPGPSPTRVLQQQYPQQGAGLNQWAAVARQPLERADAEAARRQREAAEDALVAATCPLPHLQAALHNFPSQREAFAAADQLNRHMPKRRPPHIVLSAVPVEQLLPVGSGGGQEGTASGSASRGGAALEGSVQQQGRASSSSGDGEITASGGRAGCAPCGPDSAGQPPPAPQGQQREQREQQPAFDFLSRYVVGALPAPGSGGYNTAPVAPVLVKRQRKEAEEEQRQRQQRQASKAQEYQALLRAHQEEVVAAAQRQQAQQQQAQRLQALRQRQAAANPAPAASAGQAGPAAVAAQEALWREEAVRTFCVERRARSGSYYRSFTAASYPAVWAAFRRSRCEARHWYEVVREGRPSHLYFDLEFDPRLNPQADGDGLVDRLLEFVDQQIRRHFSLALDPRCVYELDSSTPAKFSRHLTVRLPGHAFVTNHAMGKFVAQVLAASGDELLVVHGEKDGSPQLGSIVDTAVYSKNRHWRMSYCCKGGKAAVLAPTRRYATAPGATTSTAHVFLDTLVCNVDPRARLLQMPDSLPLPVGGQSGHGSGGAAGAGGAAIAASATVCGDGVQRHVAWKREAGDATLPCEHLQELQRLAEAALPFIERVAARRAGGAPARARTLAFCGAGATVAYSMIGPGSHFCENMGRAHTSNHVFFVADLVKGAYAQKCHDPDCARFRSGWMPLPPELCLPEDRAVALGLAAPPSPSGSRRSGASC